LIVWGGETGDFSSKNRKMFFLHLKTDISLKKSHFLIMENIINVCVEGRGEGASHRERKSNLGRLCRLLCSVSDPDPHSIGRPDPDPGGLKRAKMKKKRSKMPDN
jgi:hypothetical protein